MTPVIHKVFAYITHRDRLLVFRHTDFPEAGIQVPAGTVLKDEERMRSEEEGGPRNIQTPCLLRTHLQYKLPEQNLPSNTYY